jgi:cytoplasmic iron level regulating protein YaaA (DUF328/UPF0246 family)
MQIITAPSKTQVFNGRQHPVHTIPPLLHKSEQIIERLRQLERKELAELMKTSDKLTDATRQKIDTFSTPFSTGNATQAIFTFQGDAYSAIRAEEYDKDQLEHAQNSLVILSGLYGMLRPLDLMQPYRLEMGARLAIGSCVNLYSFWKDEVTALINRELKEKDTRIVNLASAEYSKVLDRKSLQRKMVTVVFKQPSKNGLKTIPIHSKRARGLMIHYAIINEVSNAEELKEFNLDGYSYQPGESTADLWLFIKASV